MRECKIIGETQYCFMAVEPLLLNEEDQDNFVERVLNEPVWDE